MAKLRPNVTPVIARLLGMSDVPQTRRMACAIIANAMVFHQRIAGMHQEVKTLRLVCGPNVANPQSETLAAWDDILKINYWPIFAIAKDILEQLPGDVATSAMRELLETAQKVEATGVDNAHDLTGRIFQRLIADRKYLATFYTLPATAALLARLAVDKMDFVDWSGAEAIGSLRIGDFACGTGGLLSASCTAHPACSSRLSILTLACYSGFMPSILSLARHAPIGCPVDSHFKCNTWF